MEIKNSGINRLPQASTDRTSSTPEQGKPAQTSGKAPAAREAQERVTLTSAVARLLENTGAENGAPVDRAKVEALRSAISEGRYEINHARVAVKLLQLEGTLPGENRD